MHGDPVISGNNTDGDNGRLNWLKVTNWKLAIKGANEWTDFR